MRAGADLVHAVMGDNLETGPRAPHLDTFRLDGDGEAGRRRRLVGNIDMGAELPSPSSRWGSSSCTQVHSINPTKKPVANTSGMARSSGDSR